jgi:hypothetical protein
MTTKYLRAISSLCLPKTVEWHGHLARVKELLGTMLACFLAKDHLSQRLAAVLAESGVRVVRLVAIRAVTCL